MSMIWQLIKTLPDFGSLSGSLFGSLSGSLFGSLSGSKSLDECKNVSMNHRN